jgi:hypothetical protein
MTVVQTLAEKIKTKGYWAITIRPAQFREAHIPSRDQLFTLVHDTAVSSNGRIIPSVDGPADSLVSGSDWIEFNSEWGADLQSWRLYQSGQFVLLLGVWTDWDGTSPWRPISTSSDRTLPLWDSLATFVAIYEFAARLSLTVAGSDQMVVSIMIKNLRDAQLVQDSPSKRSLRQHVFQGDEFTYPAGKPTPIARAELVGSSRELAARAASDLLGRFGLQTTPEVVQTWHSEF